jgi:hypothetical protein
MNTNITGLTRVIALLIAGLLISTIIVVAGLIVASTSHASTAVTAASYDVARGGHGGHC